MTCWKRRKRSESWFDGGVVEFEDNTLKKYM